MRNAMKPLGIIFTVVCGSLAATWISLSAQGEIDSAFDPGVGPNGYVNSIIVQTDGRVVIGGGFRQVNGTNRSGIARLNSDGSLDDSFNPVLGSGGFSLTDIYSLAKDPDGK